MREGCDIRCGGLDRRMNGSRIDVRRVVRRVGGQSFRRQR